MFVGGVMIKEILLGCGVLGLIVLFLMALLLPVVCTIILGTYFATLLGLTGIVWWSFVILFYIIIIGLMGIII